MKSVSITISPAGFPCWRNSRMDKTYTERARECVAETKATLQAVYNDLNHGQQKKLLRNPAIRAMFERYGVETDEK